MESHPDRDEDLAKVVDDLEENVTDEADGVPEEEQTPSAGTEQEPPD